MSIETEINRISANVSDTLSAVSEMGGEVPEGATSDDMANSVRSIPIGAKIDDTTPSTTTTYSSTKIEAELTSLNEANAQQDTEIAKKANDADLAKVAKSGSYDDLTGKPTIPTVPTTLPNPYKLKLSGAVSAEYDGSSEVSVEIPAGGSAYELPVASATQLGGVMPVAKTDEMTQAVGVDAEGKLFTAAGSGSSSVTWELLDTIDFSLEENQNATYRSYTGKWKEVVLFNDSVQNSDLTENSTFGFDCSLSNNSTRNTQRITLGKSNNWLWGKYGYICENGFCDAWKAESSGSIKANPSGQLYYSQWIDSVPSDTYIRSCGIWFNNPNYPTARTIQVWARS